MESLRQYEAAGVDELYVQQVGPDKDAFFTRMGAGSAAEVQLSRSSGTRFSGSFTERISEMRKVALCGVMLFASLFVVAPAAQASDQSIRDVVATQAQRQAKEDARFIKAVRKLSTKAQKRKAKAAAGRQAASVKLWRDALAAEQPETEPVASAKQKLLDALDLYTTGLRRFQQGLNMALRNGGNSGITKAKRAIKNMNLASKRAEQAAKLLFS